MNAHTPGPWGIGCPDGKTHYIMVGGHTEIANLPHCRAMSESSYAIESKSERESNARLIAAAPDLLAALEAMIATWEGPRELAAMRFAKNVVDARAAIARARGKL